MLHSHLRGVGVEIMAASDNVVRGGLTPKHVDAEALLGIAELEPCELPLVVAERPASAVEVFTPGVPEFALTRVALRAGTPVTLLDDGPRIVLCLDGDTHVRVDGQTLPLAKGASLFVPDADGPLTLEGAAVVFVASVPA
jgi:mannose-6-phosphate isomerase